MPESQLHAAATGKTFLPIIGLVILGIWLPAFFFDGMVHRLSENNTRFRSEAALHQAQVLMAEFDRTLDKGLLLRQTWNDYVTRTNVFLRNRPLVASLATSLDRAFRRRLPRKTRLFWFDGGTRLLTIPGLPNVSGRRLWQDFFRFLQAPDSIPPAEQERLRPFFKTLFNDLATPPFVRRFFRTSQPVIMEGQPVVLMAATFLPRSTTGTGGPALGGLLAIIPTDDARPGWELTRAIARLQRKDAIIGGFWQSREEGEGTEDLNPGLMHGLLRRLKEGRPVYSDGQTTYVCGFWAKDPDLVLNVGVTHAAPIGMGHLALPTVLHLVLTTLVVVATVGLLLVGLGRLPLHLSLRAKFRLGTIFLVGLPLAATLLGSLDLSLQFERWTIDETHYRLEAKLARLEQGISTGFTRLENHLNQLVRSPRLREKISLTELNALLYPYPPNLLWSETLLYRDGHLIRHSPYRAAQAQRMWALTLGWCRRYLASEGFDISRFADGSKAIADFQLYRGEDNAALVRNQLARMELGILQSYGYHSLAGPRGATDTSFLILSFDRSKLLLELFRQSLAEIPPGKERIFLLHHGQIPFARRSGSQEWNGIMETVRNSGQPLFSTRLFGHRTYNVLARPLQNLDTVAMVVAPAQRQGSLQFKAAGFLLLLLALALAVASLASTLLRQRLFSPLETIATTVAGMDRGDYRPPPAPISPDELGTLTGNLADLLGGLREKSRFLPFLSRTLLRETRGSRQTAARHEMMVVMFAGLRGFSRIEREFGPEESLAIMHQYLRLCERAVKAWQGEIDKFVGDSTLAVFDAAGGLPPEVRAARAALQLDREATTWMRVRTRMGKPTLRHGIGLTGGTVIVGSVGSARKRLDFTVIGDPVNLAARLEKLAGTGNLPSILATDSLADRLPPDIRRLQTDIVSVRGRTGHVRVLGLTDREDRHD